MSFSATFFNSITALGEHFNITAQKNIQYMDTIYYVCRQVLTMLI